MRSGILPVLFFLWCLCLLSACSTQNTLHATVRGTQVPSICNPAGKTQNAVLPTPAPVVQGNWPMFHGNVKRDGASSSGGESTLRLAWSYCTGGQVFSSPVVQDGIAYAASTNGSMTALDARSGKMLWQVQGDDAFYSTPIVQAGMLYAGSLKGIIYAIDSKNGVVRWQTHLDTPEAKIWSSPVIADGLLILGSASTLSENPKAKGQLLAFDTRNGTMRWRIFTQPGGQPGAGVWSSPAIDIANNVVYVGTGDPDDGVQAFDVQSGKLLWHWRSVVHDVNDTDVGAGPTLYHDPQGQLHLVVGGKDGTIYSLNAKTGSVLWQTHIGNQIFSSPAFSNGTLYVVGALVRSAVVLALDAETGAVRWRHKIPMTVYASPVIAGQTLYLPVGNGFAVDDGGIQAIDARTGILLQYIDLHSTASSSPALLSSWLFVGAHDGNLYAFVR